MKRIIQSFLFIFIFSNIIGAIGITAMDICLNRYFREIDNYKSLTNKKLYMADDFMDIIIVDDGRMALGSEGSSSEYSIYGRILSTNAEVWISVYDKEYVNWSLKYQPLYRSKLTGDVFLKDAPQDYYDKQFNSIYIGIYLKIFFYIFIGILIYLITQHIKTENIDYEKSSISFAISNKCNPPLPHESFVW